VQQYQIVDKSKWIKFVSCMYIRGKTHAPLVLLKFKRIVL